jgi:predicted PurR-regulated permease PerM
LFATALTPWVDVLDNHGVNRGIAVMGTGVAFLALVVLFGFALVPVITEQIQALVDEFPELRGNLAQFLRENDLGRAANQVDRFELSKLVPPQTLARAGTGLLGLVSTTVSLGLLTLYFLLDAHRLAGFVYYVLPEQHHRHARHLMNQLQSVVGAYIRGQLIVSTSIMAFMFVLLTSLRVDNSLALAALAFFGDMVPVIGVYLIAIPTVAAALNVSTTAAVIVGVAIVAYTQFENGFLVPKVFGSRLQLPASAVLIGILVGGQLLGFAGALLALPATATVGVLVRYWHDLREGIVPAEVSSVPPARTAPEPAPAPSLVRHKPVPHP